MINDTLLRNAKFSLQKANFKHKKVKKLAKTY